MIGPFSLQDTKNNSPNGRKSKRFMQTYIFVGTRKYKSNILPRSPLLKMTQVGFGLPLSSPHTGTLIMEESKRQKQVGKLIQQEMSDIFQREGINVING